MYACYNRQPYMDSMVVQSGWFDFNGTGPHMRAPRMVTIPFRGTRECVYTTSVQGQADLRCVGCKWQRPITADNRNSGVTP